MLERRHHAGQAFRPSQRRRAGAFSGYGAATMYDNNYQPKPAYSAALTALGGSGGGNTVTVTNPGSQSGTVGVAASVQIHATDSASGQTLTYSATGLPAGLAINSGSGLVSGTPTTAGTSSVTVTVRDTTGASGTAAFSWAVAPSGGGGSSCHVVYTKQNEWAGGFVGAVTINNTGTGTINGWTLTFTFPGDQHITNAWNATVTQNGEAVTLVNLSYNATIGPGGNTGLGFQGTWTSSDASPTSFKVNGSTCS